MRNIFTFLKARVFKHSAVFCLSVLCAATTTSVHSLSLGGGAPNNFADIVQPLLPATVNISTTTEIKQNEGFDGSSDHPFSGNVEDLFRQFLEGMQQFRPKKARSLGSGFIISQEKGYAYIVTCNHVIAKADEIKVTLNDDTELVAEVVGRDKRTDLALLKVKTDKKLTTVGWGDSSNARVGEWIIAVGNPFGLGSTVTVGVISTIARDISSKTRSIGGPDYVSGYIQTDAPINMGNSGGPMFDVNGKVLAISSTIYSPNGGSIGIGFGIPADQAAKVIADLKEHGRTKRGWLGVMIQGISPEIAESLGLKKPHGALVGSVHEKGPGKDAGIKTQDVILSFNNQIVKESKDLPHIVGETEIGKEVPVEVWRNGKKIVLKAKVGEFELAEKEGLIATDGDIHVKPKSSEQVLGMVTKKVTPGIIESYKLPSDTKGVFVTFVSPSSESYTKYIRPGDIIQQMTSGSMKIIPSTPDQVTKFIANLKKEGKKKVLLLISTKGNLRYVALSLEDEDKEKSKSE